MKQTYLQVIGISLVSVAFAVTPGDITTERSQEPGKEEMKFFDAREQASQFISYYHSIELNPKQEEVKSKALAGIAAPCCGDYSLETCCCSCNLAKSVWGLSHFLIARQGYDATKVKDVVGKWIDFTNEAGYAGDACYRGRCNKPFKDDGCGGMDERRIS